MLWWWWWWLLPYIQWFWGKIFDKSIPAYTFPFLWTLFDVEISCTHQMHSLSQNRSTVAQWAKTTVVQHSLVSCVWARLPDMFPYYAQTAQSAHSDFVGSRVYACLGVTCYLHFWHAVIGVFYNWCLCTSMGMEKASNKGVMISQLVEHWACDRKFVSLIPSISSGRILLFRVNFLCWLITVL